MNHLGTQLLETDRLILRRVKITDSQELMLGYINQEEFLYYANKSKLTLADVKMHVTKSIEEYTNKDCYSWVIVLKSNNKIVGAINLKANTYADYVEFNYAIDNRYINNGYMTEALLAVKDFCFNKLKIKRFQGGCCVENLASKRVMEKCGMECEGILRSAIKLEDGYHDMYLFSIINEIES